MWRVFSVSSCYCSVSSWCFVSVLFIVIFSPCLFPLGMMVPSWIVLRGALVWRRSSASGRRGGMRALVWPSWLPMRMMLFVLLSCTRGEMVSWF
jgi:hypothetical protein